MKLIEGWKSVLTGAWSVRLMVIACVLSAVPVFLSLVSPGLLGINPLHFAVLALVVNALAIPARIMAQTGLTELIQSYRKDVSGAVRKGTVGLLAGGGLSLVGAVALVGDFEGLRTEAYQDIVGVWTVCYGETKGVSPGDSYTKAECDEMLARELVEYEAGLDRCLTAPVPEGMKIALVSWTYNVGVGAACKSTLVRLANSGNLKAACQQLPRWNKAGGRVIRGLTNRRLTERNICLEALGGST